MNENTDTKQIGVLLLHGLAGSRKDVEPLKKHLEKSGFIVSMPVLAGHESTRAALSKSKYTEWLQTAEDAAHELVARCDKLILIGFSMGGLVSVNLCCKMDIAKLVLINTPIYYWDINRIVKNLAGDFAKYCKIYFTASAKKPILTLLEFLKLLKKTKPLLSCVNCPVLVIQTLDDDTVNAKSADYIFQKIKGEKTIKKYKTGGHVLFETDIASTVFTDICGALLSHNPFPKYIQ